MSQFLAAQLLVDAAVRSLQKPSILAETAQKELTDVRTKLELGSWTVSEDIPTFVELSNIVDDRCPDCGSFYELEIRIFKNQGELWGASVCGDLVEIGERNFISPSAAFAAIENELNERGYHNECAA